MAEHQLPNTIVDSTGSNSPYLRPPGRGMGTLKETRFCLRFRVNPYFLPLLSSEDFGI